MKARSLVTAGSNHGRSTAPKQLTGIREVARLAGVSVGTVSNVVNHPDRVSAETRAHVEAVVARLDFVPNRGAADLRRGRSRMIGLVLPDITNPFFADVARGAVDVAAERGYVAVLCNSDVNASKEEANLDLLEEQRVAGVLITPVGRLTDRLARLRSRQTGVVLVDRSAKAAEYCSVSVDDVFGGELAAGRLLASAGPTGSPALALVNGPASIRQCADRRRGAKRAMTKAGLPESLLIEITRRVMTVAEGVLAGEALLALPEIPKQVFCTNDLLAIGVLRALRKAGVSVPVDVAVIGYDDIERASDLPIPLTSVSQPQYQLGAKAINLLLAEIETNGTHRHEQVVFQPSLVERSTTSPSRD